MYVEKAKLYIQREDMLKKTATHKLGRVGNSIACEVMSRELRVCSVSSESGGLLPD